MRRGPNPATALLCFCVLHPEELSTAELVDELKTRVAARLGKPLRPESIEFVRDLPKTRNAKDAIRAAYFGNPLGDLTSLENPQTIEEITPSSP